VTKLNSKKFDFVVFDFDGVLVNSTAMKTNVFLEVISNYSVEEQNQFIEFHKRNGGVSRWDKFEYFFREIVKLADEREINQKASELADRFTFLLTREIETLTLTDGALLTLQSLEKLRKPCFIVSGASEKEVVTITKNNKIEKYFEVILGSPKNKHQNLSFLKQQGKLNGQGVFIGDSFTDYQSALDFKLFFIYMKSFSEWISREEYDQDFYLTIENLSELNTLLLNENEAI